MYYSRHRPKDLPECWGIKFKEIGFPGCHADLDPIELELKTSGYSNYKRQKRLTIIQEGMPSKAQRK